MPLIEQLRAQELTKRFSNLQKARKQILTKESNSKEIIHIVYVMTNVHICGGVKIIFEHTNRLKEAGMDVTIVSHFPKPSWYSIKANYIQIPFVIELAKGIPNCDVIVSTYWDHIQACIDTGIAPVVYFEQGDFHLFSPETLTEEYKNFIYRQLQLPQFIITVSQKAAQQIKEIYDREAKVIHNGIQDIFFKENDGIKETKSPYILMMGNDSLVFKGIKDIVEAYEIVKRAYPNLKLYWITPYDTQSDIKTKVDKVFISPVQNKIKELYKEAELFVSASHYESFSLPVLEAMASACPVITTENTGVLEYAKDTLNVLTAKIQNPNDIAQKIMELLRSPQLKEKLIANGLKTAKLFKWNRIMPKLHSYYKDISMYRVKENNLIDEWEIFFNANDFIDTGEYYKFLKYLLYTEAHEVEVPVSSLNLEDFSLAHWKTAAKRKNFSTSQNSEKCYCKTRINSKEMQALTHNEAIKDFFNKNYEEALNKFLKYYSSEEDHKMKISYIKWIVLTLFKLGRVDEALLYIETYLEQYKDYTDLYYLYFRLLLFVGKKEEADSALCIIHNLGDALSYPEHIVDVIKTSNEKGNEVYSRSLEIFEDKIYNGLDFTTEELFHYGNMLNLKGKYEESIVLYLRFLERRDKWIDHSISACCNISDCYFYMKKFEKAKRYCYKSFEYDLPRAEACCKLGFFFLQENKINEAIFWYELVTNLKKPENRWSFYHEPSWTWLPHLQLCVCYDKLGDHRKAYEHNEVARKYEPDNSSIMYNKRYFMDLGYE